MDDNVPEDLVTVIIPAYKCENVIAAAIDSVLSQTYKNVELIVVNDGSPDNVESAIDKYRDRIRYIYQENGGVSKARNTGIKNSLGKYVAFLDADDTWEENKLALQVNILNRHPDINMLFSGFHVTRNGNILSDRDYRDCFNFFKEYKYDIYDVFTERSFLHLNDTCVNYYWGNIYDKLFLGNFLLPSSVIVRKKSFQETGYFNESLKVAEETEYFLRFSGRNYIGFVDSPSVFYETPGNDNLSGKSNMEVLIKNAYKIQIDSLIENRKLLGKKYYYLKAISNTHCRLAYYYLSELRNEQCGKYALYAMKICRLYYKPYVLYAMSMIPGGMLKYVRKLKNTLKQRPAGSSGTPAI